MGCVSKQNFLKWLLLNKVCFPNFAFFSGLTCRSSGICSQGVGGTSLGRSISSLAKMASQSTCRVSTQMTVKGTQDWEFFWLRFWNLRYFFVSYVKILRFYKKHFLIGPLLWEVRFFRVVLGLRRMKKKFWGRSKFLFLFSSIIDPKYEPILVFWKLDQ